MEKNKMEQKLIRVEDNLTTEVNQYLKNDWKVIDMKVYSTEFGMGHCYCYVLLEKRGNND